MVEGAGFEPAYRVSEADLQSAAFNHSATPPPVWPLDDHWSPGGDSNP